MDAKEHLTQAEDPAELLAEAFASNDVAVIARAIGIVARAHGMTGLTEKPE